MSQRPQLRFWVVGILFSSAMLISNCGSTSGEARDTLEANRDKWFSNMFFHYQFEFRQLCMACGNTYDPSIVEVWNGLQVAATYKDTQEPVAVENLNEFLPIEDLFARALDALDRHADVVDVTYDPQLGYPQEIHVDWDRTAIDDEMDYWASDVKQL